MPQDDDLVWDEELGWVDPESPLESIGVRIDRLEGAVMFQNRSLSDFGPLKNQRFVFPLDRERLAVIRRCVEHAEWLAKQEG